MKNKLIIENWQVYLLQCADGTLYTGITNNLPKRLAEHNAGRGAKYTRGRGPVKLIFSKKYASRSKATKAELAMKKMSRAEKKKVVSKQ